MLPEQAKAMSAMGAPRYSLFFLMRLQTGEVVRAWLGVGDYALPGDDVDTTGGVFKGIGMVGDFPALRQLVGGLAERVEFSLNGAEDTVFRLAAVEMDDVIGAEIYVGIIFFDQHWQAADAVAWLWEGTADVPSVHRSSNEEGEITRTVTLSVGTPFTDRVRAALGYMTPEDQRRRSPDDAFCDRVPAYDLGSTIQWPAPK